MKQPPVALALLVGSVLLTGCSLNGRRPDGSGTVECTQVQMASQVAGRILKLPLREGDSVRAGDLVAQLDPRDYELKLQEAKAGLAQAQAQLDLMAAGSRYEDVQRAREQVREAEAVAGAARADSNRIERVYTRDSATKKQMDDAATQAERSDAALNSARLNLAKLLHGNRQEEIRVAQAQVEVARARVAQMEKAVADCAVRSPLDGILTVRSREEGEMVSAGSPIATVSRLDEVWLSVYIPETRLASVVIAQPAVVRVDGDSHSYTGTVTFIASEAEFTPRNVQTRDDRAKLVYRVKITLSNPNRRFKPGMPADGYLEKAP